MLNLNIVGYIIYLSKRNIESSKMNFNLKKPCSNCPFRNDDKGIRLTEDRAQEISYGITHQQGTFACHKTTVSDEDGGLLSERDSEHCAGALIMLEKMNQPNQMMRISERFGAYDRTKLDMNSPVFEDTEEFIYSQ